MNLQSRRSGSPTLAHLHLTLLPKISPYKPLLGFRFPQYKSLSYLARNLIPLPFPATIQELSMAHQRIRMTGLVLVMAITMLWAGAAAQSSSCTNVLISLSPCLNYITGNSSTPSSGCCTQLANVVRSQPQCLCEAIKGGGSSTGINVNQTQALALPGACNVQTPSISRCSAASPSNSPAGTTESPNTVPSGTGSKTVPSTDSSSSPSDASSTKMTISLLFFLLFIASYASTSTIC